LLFSLVLEIGINGSPDLRGFGAGVAKLRAAEKSRKCADVSRSRPHLRMQSGDPMWRRMAPHRFVAWRRWRFLSQMLMRSTKLGLTTNVSAENETATFAKPLL
jgi:hypothetical protein